MPKQIFRDFVVKAKRPEIVLPPRRERVSEAPEHVSPTVKATGFFNTRNVLGLSIIAILFLGGFFQLTTMFGKVVVKITPVEENISLDDVFVASLNKTTEKDSLSYKVMKTEESESVTIKATKGELVSKKAGGEIIVYNSHSEAPQRLITGTRFETPEGKIYKIGEAITVPGRKMVNGKTVPGSLTVTVYASEAGESYNIPPSDFTLPGLKGGPRFSTVFAKGKGEITGGFVGEMKIIPQEEVASAKKKLESSLTQKLLSKANNQIPSGYVLFPDATFLSFKDNSATLGTKSTGDKVTLTMSGSLESAIFNEKEVAQFLVDKKLPEVKNNKAHSPNISELEFKILGKSGLNISEQKSFSFKLTGNMRLVWDFNVEDFKQNLAGLNKDDYQEIFKKYNMIEKAETIFKPSWSSSFPEDPERILVELLEK